MTEHNAALGVLPADSRQCGLAQTLLKVPTRMGLEREIMNVSHRLQQALHFVCGFCLRCPLRLHVLHLCSTKVNVSVHKLTYLMLLLLIMPGPQHAPCVPIQPWLCDNVTAFSGVRKRLPG